MSSVKISIGMPVFNGKQFICEALDSLLRQTEKRFELIISDNFSNDGTYEICLAYAKLDKRIRLIRQKENIGISENFAAVLDHARGDFFLWTACDDVWSDDWLEKLISLQNSATVITFGSVVNISEKGQTLKHYKRKNLYSKSLISNLEYYLEEDTLGKANIIYGIYPTKLIKNITLDAFSSVEYAADMLFVFSCLQYGDILFDSTAILYKRVENRSAKQVTLNKFIQRVFLTERILTYLKQSINSRGFSKKMILLLFFPVKYIVSFIYNIKILSKITINYVKQHILHNS